MDRTKGQVLVPGGSEVTGQDQVPANSKGFEQGQSSGESQGFGSAQSRHPHEVPILDLTSQEAADMDPEHVLTPDQLDEYADFGQYFVKKIQKEKEKIDGFLENCVIKDRMQASQSQRTFRGELRVVLLGKTGVGKSATGNTLLGYEAFHSDGRSTSVTETIEVKEAPVEEDVNVRVIDTPGVHDTERSMDDVAHEISKVIDTFHNGVHAFLIVINASSCRFTLEDQLTLSELKKIFEDGCKKRFIVVLTHAAEKFKETSLQSFIEAETRFSALKKFLVKTVDWRVLAIDNKTKSKYQLKRHQKQLLDMIFQMQDCHGNKPLSSKLFRKAKKLAEDSRKVGSNFRKKMIEKQSTFLQDIVNKQTIAMIERGQIGLADLDDFSHSKTQNNAVPSKMQDLIKTVQNDIPNDMSDLFPSEDLLNAILNSVKAELTTLRDFVRQASKNMLFDEIRKLLTKAITTHALNFTHVNEIQAYKQGDESVPTLMENLTNDAVSDMPPTASEYFQSHVNELVALRRQFVKQNLEDIIKEIEQDRQDKHLPLNRLLKQKVDSVMIELTLRDGETIAEWQEGRGAFPKKIQDLVKLAVQELPEDIKAYFERLPEEEEVVARASIGENMERINLQMQAKRKELGGLLRKQLYDVVTDDMEKGDFDLSELKTIQSWMKPSTETVMGPVLIGRVVSALPREVMEHFQTYPKEVEMEAKLFFHEYQYLFEENIKIKRLSLEMSFLVELPDMIDNEVSQNNFYSTDMVDIESWRNKKAQIPKKLLNLLDAAVRRLSPSDQSYVQAEDGLRESIARRYFDVHFKSINGKIEHTARIMHQEALAASQKVFTKPTFHGTCHLDDITEIENWAEGRSPEPHMIAGLASAVLQDISEEAVRFFEAMPGELYSTIKKVIRDQLPEIKRDACTELQDTLCRTVLSDVRSAIQNGKCYEDDLVQGSPILENLVSNAVTKDPKTSRHFTVESLTEIFLARHKRELKIFIFARRAGIEWEVKKSLRSIIKGHPAVSIDVIESFEEWTKGGTVIPEEAEKLHDKAVDSLESDDREYCECRKVNMCRVTRGVLKENMLAITHRAQAKANDDLCKKVYSAVETAFNNTANWKSLTAAIKTHKQGHRPVPEVFQTIMDEVLETFSEAETKYFNQFNTEVTSFLEEYLLARSDALLKLCEEVKCFPGDSTVIVKGRGLCLMRDLVVGDLVLTCSATGGPSFEDIFLFSHAAPTVSSQFICLTTSEGTTLRLSHGHLVHVGAVGNLKPASEVMIGDQLLCTQTAGADGEPGKEWLSPQSVVSIKEEVCEGVYCPHTRGGSVVVDGVLASCYTTVMPVWLSRTLLSPIWLLHHWLPTSLVNWILPFDSRHGRPRLFEKLRKLFI